jgi:trk system potassium uptake protein TrkH
LNLRVVARLTSGLLGLVTVIMVAPLLMALYDGSGPSVVGFLLAGALSLSATLLLRYLGRGKVSAVHRKDALGAVALSWTLVGVLGGVPFLAEGSIHSLASATFESVSGFTTAGGTVIADVDGLSRAINLWRCLTHWIGGMGIVVLFVAIFPQLGVGAKHLFKTEVPGPITEGLRPHIKQTAVALWWIYAGLTLLLTVILWGLGMTWFEAICHAFSTLGTGGFSTRSASVGAFKSPAIDWVITIFMIIAGLNFGLFYAALKGRLRELTDNYELRFYLLVNLVVILLVFATITDRHPTLHDSLRHAAFQTAAVTSTTGFMTDDFDAYPDVARFTLFLCMFMGGCAGSTAGGLKASRVFALLKLLEREVRLVAQPSAVIRVRLGVTAVPSKVLEGITLYFGSYLILFSLSSLAMVGFGLDLVSAMTSVVACLSSVGPGLSQVGPTQNFEFIPAGGKWVLTFCMIAGRLEVLPLLAVFTREAYRH